MGRFAMLIVILLVLALPVSAFSGISSAENQTLVAADGSCQVTLSLQLQLEAVPAGLVFPVPADAEDITVNGAYAGSTYAGGVRNIDLSGYISAGGSCSLVIGYHLDDAIVAEEEKLTLHLELLSGFAYPVDSMDFTVTLPGPVEARPAFSSTYYQDTIETMMTVEHSGAKISGTVDQRLQDHEKLTMTLAVDEEMFPRPESDQWLLTTPQMLMLVITVLALLYWLAAMRCKRVRRLRRTDAPEGICAGAIGCCLTGSGVDFTMMVISWAQMGYILIQPDDNGRVLLHKRMEMGNERSDFENRYFRQLFGSRRVVDGTGYRYAELCRKAARSVTGAQDNYRRSSGNPKVLRVLMALVGALSGVSIATALVSDGGWQTVLSVVLFLLGAAAAWLMQSAAGALRSRRRLDLWIGLGAAFLWLLLGLAAGPWITASLVILSQLLAGLAAFFGGLRTENGRQVAGELLGLRHYLKNISAQELKRVLKQNPHFYYDLAPYALALGVDRAFTRKLKKARLPQCPYLTTGMDGHLTVTEWNRLLRDTVAALDELQLRLPMDRLLGK